MRVVKLCLLRPICAKESQSDSMLLGLENLLRLAYPRKEVEGSSTLKEKFLTSIPRRYWKQIKAAMALTKTMAGNVMGW